MNKMFKENYVLIAGILLPIIMIFIFGLATFIPGFFVEAPKYDLLFSLGYNDYNKPKLVFNIVQGKLKTQLVCDKYCSASDMQNNTKLYIYDAKLKKSHEIQLSLPNIPSKEKSFTLEVSIPQVNNLKIDPAVEAPDGYVYNSGSDTSGLISDLFFRSSYNQPTIAKKGNNIEIMPNLKNFDYYNIKFIGWVLSNQGNAHVN